MFVIGLFMRQCLLAVFSAYVLAQTVIQTAKGYKFFFQGGISHYLDNNKFNTDLEEFGREAYHKLGVPQEVLAISSVDDSYLRFRIQYALAPLVLNYDLSNDLRQDYILHVSSTVKPLEADADACGERFECQLVHERDSGYRNLKLRLSRIIKEPK